MKLEEFKRLTEAEEVDPDKFYDVQGEKIYYLVYKPDYTEVDFKKERASSRTIKTYGNSTQLVSGVDLLLKEMGVKRNVEYLNRVIDGSGKIKKISLIADNSGGGNNLPSVFYVYKKYVNGKEKKLEDIEEDVIDTIDGKVTNFIGGKK